MEMPFSKDPNVKEILIHGTYYDLATVFYGSGALYRPFEIIPQTLPSDRDHHMTYIWKAGHMMYTDLFFLRNSFREDLKKSFYPRIPFDISQYWKGTHLSKTMLSIRQSFLILQKVKDLFREFSVFAGIFCLFMLQMRRKPNKVKFFILSPKWIFSLGRPTASELGWERCEAWLNY